MMVQSYIKALLGSIWFLAYRNQKYLWKNIWVWKIYCCVYWLIVRYCIKTFEPFLDRLALFVWDRKYMHSVDTSINGPVSFTTGHCDRMTHLRVQQLPSAVRNIIFCREELTNSSNSNSRQTKCMSHSLTNKKGYWHFRLSTVTVENKVP